MNISEITLVQTRLNVLINQPLTQVDREADMLLLRFGTQYSMRIQCYYRLTEQGRTILARNDVYQPSEAMWAMWRAMGYEDDYIPEDFHSDDEGCNRLDEAIERLNGDLDGLTIRTAMLNQLGDLTMVFHCGATLTITAIGCYAAHINGSRVGSFVLAPGWTSYDKRIQVQTYRNISRAIFSGLSPKQLFKKYV